jgi:hypothetical protein
MMRRANMTGTSLVVFYISQHISSCYEACGRLGLSGVEVWS